MVIFGLLTRYFTYAYFPLFCVFLNEMHIIAYYACISRYFFYGSHEYGYFDHFYERSKFIVHVYYTSYSIQCQSDVVLDSHTQTISFVR